MSITFPEATLRVRPWEDSTVKLLGFSLQSEYVETFWLPVLGPSATLLVRRLGRGLRQAPNGYTIDVFLVASELGLGNKGGKNSPMWRSVNRICRFGAAQRNGDILAVRTALPPVPPSQLRRLPTQLQRSHQSFRRVATPS